MLTGVSLTTKADLEPASLEPLSCRPVKYCASDIEANVRWTRQSELEVEVT